MNTITMLRSTLTAAMSLTVLIACDNRGVTAMQARMYTPEERAQSRALMAKNRGSNANLPSGETLTPAQNAPGGKTARTNTPEQGETPVTPHDEAKPKNFFEKADATNKTASIRVEQLKQIVLDQLGQINEDAQKRVLGITITNKSTAAGSVIDLDAIISFRKHEQIFGLRNIKIEPAAKDLVFGTSKVDVKNKLAANVDEEAIKPITTDELLVASVCLDQPMTAVCKHAYLIIQFGREDKAVDAAVFELDETMTIVNSNIGMPPVSFNKALYVTKGPVYSGEGNENAGMPASATIQPVKRTLEQRLARLCHLRPNSPKCLAKPAATIEVKPTAAAPTAPAVKPAAASVAKPDAAAKGKQAVTSQPVLGTPAAPAKPAEPTKGTPASAASAAAAPASAADAPHNANNGNAPMPKPLPNGLKVTNAPMTDTSGTGQDGVDARFTRWLKSWFN